MAWGLVVVAATVLESGDKGARVVMVGMLHLVLGAPGKKPGGTWALMSEDANPGQP